MGEPAEETLLNALEKFDRSHTGSLSREEFQRFFEMFLRSALPKLHDASEAGKEKAYEDMKKAQADLKRNADRLEREFEASFERWYNNQSVELTKLSYHSMQWI